MVRPLALGVVLLLVVSGAGAVVSGASATAPAADAAVDVSPATADEQPASTADDATANQSEQRQFAFSIENVSDCGVTCRDVTVTARNTGNTTAENVTVETQLIAGEKVVWQGNESVDQLEPNESTTVTKRVRLGIFDVVAVEQNDGYVTANTTVTWDGGNETFSERRKVA